MLADTEGAGGLALQRHDGSAQAFDLAVESADAARRIRERSHQTAHRDNVLVQLRHLGFERFETSQSGQLLIGAREIRRDRIQLLVHREKLYRSTPIVTR
ncbi:hypothetical protein GCM10009854_18520 [Saccharopolyspora halophila]|uniref:Uncharacterized protein n=1 Tax=Saccharopolyspora halophila TaxID=405551 RepID=A0ABP5T1U7_9PSEU